MLIPVILAIASALPVSTPAIDEAIERSRAAVHQVMENAPVPGISLAVALDGKLVYEEAFGYASLADSIAATTGTKFGIGSITKSLTLALVQRFVDQGLLDWDQPVETWLPGFPYSGHGLTLRHIGVHQSGIDDGFIGELRYTRKHYDTQASYDRAVARPLTFEPGTRTSYGTAGFSVIARVIEEITGEPFDDVLQREVLAPAGMTETVPLDPCVQVDGLTSFYEMRSGELVAVTADPSYKRAGAGYVATAADLVRFGVALDGGKVCSTDELFRSHSTRDGTPSDFGLGWRTADDEGRFAVYQPGGGPGISGYVVIYPEQDLVFAILSNDSAAPVGGAIMGETLAAFLELAD